MIRDMFERFKKITEEGMNEKAKWVICKNCGARMDFNKDANRYFRETPEAWSCPECMYITEIEENPKIIYEAIEPHQKLGKSMRMVTKGPHAGRVGWYVEDKEVKPGKKVSILKGRNSKGEEELWEVPPEWLLPVKEAVMENEYNTHEFPAGWEPRYGEEKWFPKYSSEANPKDKDKVWNDALAGVKAGKYDKGAKQYRDEDMEALKKHMATPQDISKMNDEGKAGILTLHFIGYLAKPIGIDDVLYKKALDAFNANRGKTEREEEAVFKAISGK